VGGARFLDKAGLTHGETANEFQGFQHDAGISFIVIDAPPGSGPKLHKHPYEESSWCRRSAPRSRPETRSSR